MTWDDFDTTHETSSSTRTTCPMANLPMELIATAPVDREYVAVYGLVYRDTAHMDSGEMFTTSRKFYFTREQLLGALAVFDRQHGKDE